MVQKAAKFKKRFKKVVSGPKSLQEASWKHVKLNGPVISDEGADLAGFIGLEILENYDRTLVKKDKTKKPKDDDQSEDDIDIKEPQKRKRKLDSDDESGENSPKKMSKKPVNMPKAIKQKTLDKPVTPIENKSSNLPGRFVLLRPPVAEDKPKRKPKRKSTSTPKNSCNTGGPNSQPYSFEDYTKWMELGVSEPIIRALADKGFRHPTEIQTLSLPVAIMGKRDILGAAETGSGKTLAFGIPLLEGIMSLIKAGNYSPIKKSAENDHSDHELTPPPEDLDYYPALNDEEMEFKLEQDLEENDESSMKPLYALILTPTRELAVQIHDHLKVASKYTNINIATVFGGLASVKQERMLKKCPEIVIATPGRLWELIQAGNQHLSKVDNIRFLVIDETDRMLEKGHFDELKQLLGKINMNEEATKLRRNYVFSATLTLDHDLPEHLKSKSKHNKTNILKQTTGQKLENLINTVGMTNPKVIDITQQHATANTLIESRILCKAEHKDYYLYYFLQRHAGRTLVFCNSIDCVKRLVSLFTYLNCDPLSLFGSMQQRQRLRNLERFTENPNALLIATDVAARGLDIPNVDHVIHYQVPKTAENYVHRSGRTARASKEGLAVLLIGPNEVKDYVRLNQALGRTEDLPMYPTSERTMKQIKQRVNMARDIEKMDLQQRRNSASQSWEEQIAKEFQSDSDIDSEQEEERQMAKHKMKRQMKARRLELSRLLATPIVLDRVELKFPTSEAAIRLPSEKEDSAISLVKQMVEKNKQLKLQRNKKRTKNSNTAGQI